jgi:WD40 repeat protein
LLQSKSNHHSITDIKKSFITIKLFFMRQFTALLSLLTFIFSSSVFSSSLYAQDVSATGWATLTASTAPLRSVAFSNDSRIVAASDDDGVVYFWSMLRWNTFIKSQEKTGKGFGIAFRETQQTLVAAGETRLVQIAPSTGSLMNETATSTIKLMSPSLNGEWAALLNADNQIEIRAVGSGKMMSRFQAPFRDVSALALNDNGTYLAIGATQGGDAKSALKLWNVQGEKEIQLWGETMNVTDVAFSPDGKLFASAGSDTKIWRLSSGHVQRTLPSATAVAFSPDGEILATASRSTNNEQITLWRVQTGEKIRTLTGHTSDVTALAFTDDGQFLASTSRDRTLKLWQLSGVASRATLKAPTAPPKLSAVVSFAEPSGNGLLDSDESGKLILTVKNTGEGDARTLRAAVTSESGRIFVGESSFLTELAQGDSGVIQVPLTYTGSTGGEERLRISLGEQNGFDLDFPLQTIINTGAASRADFMLSDLLINDASGNGQIEPREVVEVTARLQNRSRSEAKSVTAAVNLGEGVFLTPDSQQQFTLGNIKSGDFRDVVFSIYTAPNAASAVPVSLTLRDERTKSSFALPLGLAVGVPLARVKVPSGRNRAEDNLPPSDVDINIPKVKQKNPNAIAIVFGIEKYKNLSGVTFARRDASIFKEYAINTLGVTDDNAHLYFKVDNEVTRGEFEKLFGEDGWLSRRATPESEIIIYYSGHGAPELRDKSPYLIPYDGDANYAAQTGFSLNRLYTMLAGLNAKSVTVYLDACFSGATREKEMLLTGARPILVKIENPVLQSEKILVVAAASGEQVSSAYPDKRHGIFTYYLLKAFRGEASKTKSLRADELESYLTEHVKRTAANLDREQTPQLLGKNKQRMIIK